MPVIKLLAPAKLNLFLHITGRRPDGYHELQTLYQLLDFGDPMEFRVTARPGISFHADTTALPTRLPMESNLVLRAAEQMRQLAAPQASGIHIQLSKKIPLGAGLGGGSADAAMTLIALNELWQLGLGLEELSQIGLLLGADVPVFIHGKSAWAEGIGERLTAVEIPPAWYLVITPSCAVSTQVVFCHQDLTRNTPAIKMADFLAGGVHNDCESVTRSLYPEVAAALDWLRGFADAKMTGTGSSVFAAFKDAASAHAVLQEIPSTCHGFVARGLNSLTDSALK